MTNSRRKWILYSLHQDWKHYKSGITRAIKKYVKGDYVQVELQDLNLIGCHRRIGMLFVDYRLFQEFEVMIIAIIYIYFYNSIFVYKLLLLL